MKNIFQNVRGATVTVALSRRPYPPPSRPDGVAKRRWAVVHRVLSTVVHSCLWITHVVMLKYLEICA